MARARSVREIIQLSRSWLEERGVEEGRLDTELLLAHVLGCRRIDLFLDLDRPMIKEEVDAFRVLLRRRGKREPLAYILGRREFYSLSFKTSPAALIPRPETEHLVDFALEALAGCPREGGPRWADVGTGSGCIAVAIAKNLEAGEGFATDISSEALALARENAETHGLGERIRWFEGDLCAPLEAAAPLDLIISNPPYIAPGEPLAPEIADHEPATALYDTAADGLALSRRLAAQALALLAPGGLLIIELGAGRGAAARAMLEELGYQDVTLKRDYGGHERLVVGVARAAGSQMAGWDVE